MKLCEKCGAVNSDDKFFCVDCSEKLNEPVSDAERKHLEAELNGTLEELYVKTDPLAVTLFDKVAGSVCISGIAVLTVMFFIAVFRKCELGFYLYGFLLFALGVADAFFPRISWELEKLRLSFTISDAENATPSDLYMLFRRLGIALCAGLGAVVIVVCAMGLSETTNKEYNDTAEQGNKVVIVQRGGENEYIEFE